MSKTVNKVQRLNHRRVLYQNMLVLREAIRKKKTKMVRYLLEKNPNLTQALGFENDADSPMWLAMSKGSDEIVEMLVKSGAKINEWYEVPVEKSKEKRTLNFFHWLALSKDFSKHKKTALLLIKLGADLSMENPDIATPLEAAVLRSKFSYVEFLLKKGAKLKDPEYVIKLIIKLKARDRRKMLLVFIQNGLDMNYHSSAGENLLHIMSRYQNYNDDEVAIAQVFLDAGVPIDEPNNNHQSPLQQAISLNGYRLASFFVKKGADVNFQHNQGWTALHYACKLRDDRTIVLLIQNGAQVSVQDSHGRSPFGVLKYTWVTDDVRTMIREIAKLSFENKLVLEDDMEIIQNDEVSQAYFNNCKNELPTLKNTKFHGSLSYYSILRMTKNLKRLTKLSKNKEFVRKFKEGLTKFPLYMKDLICIYDEALKLKNEKMMVQSRVRSVFGDSLSEDVVKKLGNKFTIEDLPLY